MGLGVLIQARFARGAHFLLRQPGTVAGLPETALYDEKGTVGPILLASNRLTAARIPHKKKAAAAVASTALNNEVGARPGIF
jgi:hypothetical protein